MRHFPIFLDLDGRRVVVAGGGAAALAKLRLLLKTDARIVVFSANPGGEIVALATEGRIALVRRRVAPSDLSGAALVYAANEAPVEDGRVAGLARDAGVPANIVDNLEGSAFITPAIVDRDPVTVAIGTEGAAPVLARSIKSELEERLPAALGLLARIGKAFRPRAERLPQGRRRRAFWAEYYDVVGPRAAPQGEAAVRDALAQLLEDHETVPSPVGHVAFVGAGPGNPELLTIQARRALDAADVVIHDRLVPARILELARREATIVEAGKEGFGPSWNQADINALMLEHARQGAQVVRLKSGDPTVFGRLDEEMDACDAAGVGWSILPGLTAASAAAAALGQSLTRRGRNSEVRFLTGHDMAGFAEHDWRALARPGAVAAVYMGKRAARFVQGRLLMHGADPDLPVSVVENAGCPDQRIVATTLGALEPDLLRARLQGPALVLLGLAPRNVTRGVTRETEDHAERQEAVQ